MIHQISHIRRHIFLFFLAITVIAVLTLFIVTPLVSDLSAQAAQQERLTFIIFTPVLLIAAFGGLYWYLHPVSTLGRTFDLGSSPSHELVSAARQVAFSAPLYFFILPTAGVFVASVSADVFGILFLPDYAFPDHFSRSILMTVIAACGALVFSIISRHWLRPVLLYTAEQSQFGGRRFSIRAQLFSITLILTLIAVFFSGLLAYNQAVVSYRQQLGDQMRLYLSRAVDSMPTSIAQEDILPYIMDNWPQNLEYHTVILIGRDGHLIEQRVYQEPAIELDVERWQIDSSNLVRQAQGYFALMPILTPAHGQWVGIGYQANPLDSTLVRRTLITLSIFSAGMILLVALISNYLAQSVVLDLRFLTGRLLDIAHKEQVNLTKAVPVLSLDEVGDLIQAYNALQERVRLQQTQIEHEQNQLVLLQSLSYKIASIREPDRLLNEVVRDVEHAFGYQNVCILLEDQARQELIPAAYNRPQLARFGSWLRVDKSGPDNSLSIIEHVAQTRVPILAGDMDNCPLSPSTTGICSEMAVPLLVGERVIGVFDVSSDQTHAFDESNLRILTALGNQVAIALENARLIQEATRSAKELERRAQNLMTLHNISTTLNTALSIDDVLTLATQELVDLFQVDHSTVLFFEAEDEYGRIAAEHPAQGLIGQIVPLKNFMAVRRLLMTPAPLFVSDAQNSELTTPVHDLLKSVNVCSLLFLPLQSKGIVMGALTLDVIGRERQFSAEEFDICRTIAAQVAVAVENTRLFEDMRLQTDMLARLADDVSDERSRLDAVLRNLVDGLVVTDPTGRIILANSAFISLFNLEQKKLTGAYISDAVPELPLQHLVLQTGYDQVVQVQEFALDDGRFLQCTAAIVREEKGASSVVLVLRDVTRERRLDQLKSNFISSISHELRTPLTIVSGFARRIRQSFDKHITPVLPAFLPEDGRPIQRVVQNMDNLISGVQRLENLVEDVLIIADIDAGRFQWHIGPVNTGATIQSVVDTYRQAVESKGLSFQVHIPDRLPQIAGDEERLAIVLKNLLENALKFTQEGQIVVQAQAIYRQDGQWRPTPSIHLPDQLIQDAYILVTVRDTGVGIAPDVQQALFERFGQGMRDVLTDKPAGTGLGLSISKEIVAYHGGHIWVESELNRGSTFAFVIPFVAIPIRADAHPSTPNPTVLVVDDEKATRELLHYILSAGGYQTLMAADGQSALNMVHMHKPDLIILDIMLPGISGLEVASILKSDETTRHIPVVIFSVIADPYKAAEVGADACLAKPADPKVLLTTLADLLHNRQNQTD